MIKLVYVIIISTLLFSAPAGAQTRSDNGLETANYKYVALVVEGLSADAGSIGLTKDRIQTRVELQLRSAGLTPGNDPSKNATYLYVNILVTGSAFHVSVEYNRSVDFTTGDQQYYDTAATWDAGSGGTHGGNAGYIMNSLDSQLAKFLNEYLKVNQK